MPISPWAIESGQAALNLWMCGIRGRNYNSLGWVRTQLVFSSSYGLILHTGQYEDVQQNPSGSADHLAVSEEAKSRILFAINFKLHLLFLKAVHFWPGVNCELSNNNLGAHCGWLIFPNHLQAPLWMCGGLLQLSVVPSSATMGFWNGCSCMFLKFTALPKNLPWRRAINISFNLDC